MSTIKTKVNSSERLQRMKRELINPKSITTLNLLIDSDLHMAFKMKTTANRVSMTDVIVHAIEQYISKE